MFRPADYENTNKLSPCNPIFSFWRCQPSKIGPPGEEHVGARSCRVSRDGESKSEVVTMGDSDKDDTEGMAFVLTEVKIEYTLYIQQSFEVFRTSWIAPPCLSVKNLAS